jgi:HD-like signal output (HDOD) protein
VRSGQRRPAGDETNQRRGHPLPPATSGLLDERLVHLLHRALARDPESRYASAAQMREALDDYLEPETAAAAADSRQSTIDFLLRRMRHKSDFPALSESVGAINRITASENQSISEVSNTILKDFSLTNKILRMVNSVYYQQAGGGNISTVSRAVVVLGLDAVRSIAITVLLLEHLQNKDNANQLKDEFLRANLAGVLAREIGSSSCSRQDIEQVFICSMFHNLGRLLSQYYFPEESAEIRRALLQKSCSEEAAALQVLGISFEDLGVSAIAQTWGFPRLIVNSMRRLPAGSIRRPLNPEDRLRVLSALSNELCTVIADTAAERQQRELRTIATRFGDAIALDEQELRRSLDKSLEQMAQFARSIHLNLQETRFGRQIRAWGGAKSGSSMVDATPSSDGLNGTVLLDVVPAAAAADDQVAEQGAEAVPVTAAVASEAILLAGIQDVSNALVSEFKLNDVLRITLETIYRAKGFKRVILCIRERAAIRCWVALALVPMRWK